MRILGLLGVRRRGSERKKIENVVDSTPILERLCCFEFGTVCSVRFVKFRTGQKELKSPKLYETCTVHTGICTLFVMKRIS